jgi:2-polyprenyl-3-methyl-5-hydroxy-6-metoxy-1,4-benzoquinol methylase
MPNKLARLEQWKARRRKKIEPHINFNGNALEIGAGYMPLYPKDMGYKVKTLDHVSEEEFEIKYKNVNVDISGVEKVDFVWNGESYLDLVKDERFDWIVASHVIEHVPDLIGFLKECTLILKKDGVLVLFIPDRRYTLDYFRSTSSLSSIIDAHVLKRDRPSPGSILEALFLETNSYKDSNNPYDGDLAFYETPNQNLYNSSITLGEYRDVHVWVFTPSHFRMLIEDLYLCGAINLREKIYFPSEGREFCIILSRDGKGPNLSRLALARKMCRERKVNVLKAGRGTGFIKDVVPVFLNPLYEKIKKMRF